ncbi:hypothetical protein [Spirosoma sp. KNUC1025]|uniref:hypothetical protein n=1 Tax=Spirosoma sp. KNUC1025 TaxID=2894082 RepID=UPI0038694CBE|nr:hypothetical protein LN737_28415 [Spirosoma sp. KNUC1025]
MSPLTLFFVVWTLFILIGLSLLIYPVFQNRAMKAATIRFGKQLQQDPTQYEAFAQTLYKPIGWVNMAPDRDTQHVLTLLDRLPPQVGNFSIHYKQWVGQDSCLLITTVDYLRPEETGDELVAGSPLKRTRITYNLNFVVRLDTLKKQVVVLSDLYITLIDKNLRADFAGAIFTLLQL